jgi:5-methylcytosine-specific restriction endonuclease McrA
MHKFICKKCNKSEQLQYKTFWYRTNKGTGMCQVCAQRSRDKSTYSSHPAWNKGLNVSGMSGKKQSDKQKEVTRSRNLTFLSRSEEHHNWKGGVSDKNRQIRNLRKYKEWRDEIFKRDDYTCLECFKKGVYIEAHHIKKFSEYPELRLDIGNGITLCKSCHNNTKTREELFETKYLNKLANV